VTLFFLVAQLIAWVFFHETPSRAVIAGGALILAGGAVITWWR
jgi:drug/metabolite transporter (DMT)-like permease